MVPKNVGLIVFDRMAADELTGPAEIFSRARISTSDECGSRCYQITTLGIGTARCVMECGLVVNPQLDINEAPQLDTVVVPGGAGIHDKRLSKKLTKWLCRRAAGTRRIAAVGTGIYVLAETGLLNERHVATHWHFAKDVAFQFPRLQIHPNALFIKDGPFYSCAGGASAFDLSLALIEEDFGRQIALSLARELVVHSKRSGAQEQCSETLQFQIQSSDRFADLPAWILSHLGGDLSIEKLAEQVCMSPRNFTRLFKAAFGKAPAEFVANVRIAEARRRLEVPRNNIDSVATSVGFRSADAFSRAFERAVGCRPSTYRARRGATLEDDFAKQRSELVEPLLAHA